MSNDYFVYSNPIDDDTRALSTQINARFLNVQAGFDLLPNIADINARVGDYAADTGAMDAYVVALPNAPASYTEGMKVRFKPAKTNSGASTINVNGLGAKNIVLPSGASLTGSPAEIRAGTIVEVAYDGAQFRLISAYPVDLGDIDAATQAFLQHYQGASASDPATRLDTSSLQDGDLYFNTTTNRFKAYESGTGWLNDTTIPDGSASVPGFAFASDSDTGFYLSGAGAIEVTSGGTQELTLKKASQGEAEAGTDNLKLMTPLRVKQAVAAQVSTASIYDDVHDVGNITGSVTLDRANGRVQRATLTGNATINLSAASGTDQSESIFLWLTDPGSNVITWGSDIDWLNGTAPDLPATGLAILQFRRAHGETNWKASYEWSTSFTTDDLAEGSANLYFTEARAQAAVDKTHVGLGNVPNEDATDMANWDQKGAVNGQVPKWDSHSGAWVPGSVAGATLSASDITNDSAVTGANVDDALDQLNSDIGAISAPVNSVFGRLGDIAPSYGDYDANQILNTSTVAGHDLESALDNLSSEVSANTTQLGNLPGEIHVSTSNPTGGNDGDVWLKYV